MANYLHPTYPGLRYAVASPQQDSLRCLLHGLIQHPNTTTSDLDRFVDQDNFGSRKDVGVALFKLQGKGLIGSYEDTTNIPTEDLDEALQRALGRVSIDGNGMLAEQDGFVVAYTGYSKDMAQELAASGTNMLPMGERLSDDEESGEPWEITVTRKGAKVTFMRLNAGGRTFLLASGEIDENAAGFRDIVTLLIQRYLANV